MSNPLVYTVYCSHCFETNAHNLKAHGNKNQNTYLVRRLFNTTTIKIQCKSLEMFDVTAFRSDIEIADRKSLLFTVVKCV